MHRKRTASAAPATTELRSVPWTWRSAGSRAAAFGATLAMIYRVPACRHPALAGTDDFDGKSMHRKATLREAAMATASSSSSDVEAEVPAVRLARMHSDSKNWSGFVYFCKADPRLFVPKKQSWAGWTINFGHDRGCWAMLLIVFVLPLLTTGLATYAATRSCERARSP